MEGVTESGATEGSAETLVHCASIAPLCGLGAFAFGSDSTVVSWADYHLRKAAPQEDVTVERLLIQVAATDLGASSCSVVKSVPASGVADGCADTLAQCASIAPLCGLVASMFCLDSAVVPEMGWDLGRAVLQAVFAVDRPLIQETGMSTPFYSVAESVTEGGAADANAGAQDHCADTDPPCGLVSSAFGLDFTMVSKTSCDLGKAARQELVTAQRSLIQVAATDLGTLSCSVAEGVTEGGAAGGSADHLAHCASTAALQKIDTVNGSLIQVTASSFCASPYSVKEGVTEDVARNVTGSRGDLGSVALQKLVNMHGVWISMTTRSLRASFCLVMEGVTEGGAAVGTRPRGNFC